MALQLRRPPRHTECCYAAELLCSREGGREPQKADRKLARKTDGDDNTLESYERGGREEQMGEKEQETRPQWNGSGSDGGRATAADAGGGCEDGGHEG